MKVAMLSSIAWRTPPRHYGPWEQVASTLAEGLIQRGVEVTLFATADSITQGRLDAVCEFPYAEHPELDPKVWECLHIANVMEKASQFDVIHNHFDFLPLTYSSLVKTPILTTIHGFSSLQIIPVYEKYNSNTSYVSISNADRHPALRYLRTIYHGINPSNFHFRHDKEDYLLYFGRIHPDKGAHVAIEIAKRSGYVLKIAGLIQDHEYFTAYVKPHIDGEQVVYLGNVGPDRRNELLGRAKALLHPISFEEPFGLSVIEAMMCGTPVIAFNRGSMSELIINGVTGYLVVDVPGAVDAVGAIDQIESKNCRDHAVAHFGLDRMIDEYLNVYTAILEGNQIDEVNWIA